MNWIEELKSIYKTLDDQAHHDVKKVIFEAQLSGGTGGEIFLMVTQELKNIRSKQPSVYKLISDQADRILKYGKEIGYLSED